MHLKLCRDRIKHKSTTTTKRDLLQINYSSADTVSFYEQRAVACTRRRTIVNRSGLLLNGPSSPLLWLTSHRYVAGLGLTHQPFSEFIRGARAAAVCTGESARGVVFFSSSKTRQRSVRAPAFLPAVKHFDKSDFSA